MTTYQLHPIGTIHNNGEDMFLTLSPEYIPALQALDGFSHLQVLWWFSDFDTKEARAVLETEQPYKNAPAVMGIFATRSPIRHCLWQSSGLSCRAAVLPQRQG